MGQVTVNKGFLVGVVVVAAGSLLALAFVLGRASGSGSLSGQPSGRELADSVVASPVPHPRTFDLSAQPTPLPISPAALITEPAETRPSPVPFPGERPSPGSDSARAAVAAYLDAVDQIQPEKMSGDAESTANDMAAALARGDTSALDSMVRETEAAKESLAALTPPASCAAHYRESLGSVDDALEMLRSLKTAMKSPDPSAHLGGVATRASALRTRSEALRREETALRQRYGLTR